MIASLNNSVWLKHYNLNKNIQVHFVTYTKGLRRKEKTRPSPKTLAPFHKLTNHLYHQAIVFTIYKIEVLIRYTTNPFHF